MKTFFVSYIVISEAHALTFEYLLGRSGHSQADVAFLQRTRGIWWSKIIFGFPCRSHYHQYSFVVVFLGAYVFWGNMERESVALNCI